jgi:hypothetical protein
MTEARKKRIRTFLELNSLITPLGFLILVAAILIVVWLVISLVFYAAGRVVSGINTTFTDAMIVALVGAICYAVLTAIFQIMEPTLVTMLTGLGMGWFAPYLGFVASSLITLCVYIPLIMKFFDTGFWGAVAVGLLVIIFQIVLAATIFIIVLILAL